MCAVNRHWRAALLAGRLWESTELEFGGADSERSESMLAWALSRAQVSGAGGKVQGRMGGGMRRACWRARLAYAAAPQKAASPTACLHPSPPQGIRSLSLAFEDVDQWAMLGFLLGALRPSLRHLDVTGAQ